MHAERFNDLISILETVPEDQFNMDSWWKIGCKTLGCAIGHYCHARPEAALRIEILEVQGSPYCCTPVIKGKEGWLRSHWAVAEYFGITPNDADFLFYSSSYRRIMSEVTKSLVLGRLLKFYNEHLPQQEVMQEEVMQEELVSTN